MMDFIELSKLIEDLGNDSMLGDNNGKLKDIGKDLSANCERSQIYTSLAEQEEPLCISPSSKNNRCLQSTSQIPNLRGHVDIECCYCFHKQNALEQKQG